MLERFNAEPGAELERFNAEAGAVLERFNAAAEAVPERIDAMLERFIAESGVLDQVKQGTKSFDSLAKAQAETQHD